MHYAYLVKICAPAGLGTEINDAMSPNLGKINTNYVSQGVTFAIHGKKAWHKKQI